MISADDVGRRALKTGVTEPVIAVTNNTQSHESPTKVPLATRKHES